MYKSFFSIAVSFLFLNIASANEKLFDVGLSETDSKLEGKGQKIKDGTYKLKSDDNALGFKKYIVDITPVSKTTYQITASKKTDDCLSEIVSISNQLKRYYGQDLDMMQKGDTIMYQNSNYIIKTECNKVFLSIRVVSKSSAKLFLSEYKEVKNNKTINKSEYSISEHGALGVLFSDDVNNNKFKHEKGNMYSFEPVKPYGIFMSYYIEKDKKTDTVSKIMAGTVIKDVVRLLGFTPNQFCNYAIDSIRKDIVENTDGIINESKFEGLHSLELNTGNIGIMCQDNQLVFSYTKK